MPGLRSAVCALATLSSLLLGAGAPPVLAQAPAAHHELSVRLDPAGRRLEAEADVRLPPGPALTLSLAARFEVESMELDGAALPAGALRDGLRRWLLPAAAAERRLHARWRGTLAPLDESGEHRATLGRLEPAGDARGAFLPAASRWFPVAEGLLGSYRVRLDVPEDVRALVAGELVEESVGGGRYRARFEFAQPAEGMDLMAGPYRVVERMAASADGRALRLRTYLHEEVAALAGDYLESVAGYIALYEKQIGDYPYAGFSVVSSPTPTGFGMPTLTYLGIDVIRLPFMRATSLGHEVLHNWWGNGVYPDFERGNWSEGLTTFMADYAYKAREGEQAARAARLAWLADFAAVPQGQDPPLAEFTSRSHGTSQIVGYNKSAMVFFMLRELIGAEAFERGLRRFWREQRFRVAGWDELRRAFEAEAGRDLAAWFAQWLTRAGAPAPRIESARWQAGRLVVDIVQSAPAYALQVPLRLSAPAGAAERAVAVDSERTRVEFALDARPSEVALDPDLRLFRRLAPGEAPPILRQAGLDPATALRVLSAPLQDEARKLAARLLDHAPSARAAGAPGPRGPLLVMGTHADVDRWLAENGLPARPTEVSGPGSLHAWAARQDDGAALVVVAARNAEALAAAARALPHYGRQSYVVFEGARAGLRGVWPPRPAAVRVD